MVRKPEVGLPLTIPTHFNIVVEDDMSHQGFQCKWHQETSRLRPNIHVRQTCDWVLWCLRKTYTSVTSVSERQIPCTCGRHHVIHAIVGSASHEAEPIKCIRVFIILLVEVSTERCGHERPPWDVRSIRKRECLYCLSRETHYRVRSLGDSGAASETSTHWRQARSCAWTPWRNYPKGTKCWCNFWSIRARALHLPPRAQVASDTMDDLRGWAEPASLSTVVWICVLVRQAAERSHRRMYGLPPKKLLIYARPKLVFAAPLRWLHP